MNVIANLLCAQMAASASKEALLIGNQYLNVNVYQAITAINVNILAMK